MSSNGDLSPQAQARPLHGFVDAVESECVYGWAWNPSAPSEKLEVDIWLDDVRLGTVCADRARADLEKLAISDGACAFEFSPSTPFTAQQCGRVTAFARATASDDAVALPRLSGEAQRVAALEQAVRRLPGALDHMAGRQEQALLEHSKALESLSERVDALQETLRTHASEQAEYAGLAQELRERIATFEVIQARIDTALVEVTGHAGADREPGSGRGPGWLGATLAVFAVASAGALGYFLGQP